MTKHTHYTEDFKRQAVELLETRNTTATQLARELGVRQNQLYKWREEIKKKGSEAFKVSLWNSIARPFFRISTGIFFFTIGLREKFCGCDLSV